MATPKERAVACKSLILLLQAVEGRTTTVELRNEIVVHGTIDKVDSYMNVDMANVRLTVPASADGSAASPAGRFEQFHIQGRQVRYVHIPDDIDMMAALKQKLEALRGGRGRGTPAPAGIMVLKTRHMREKIVRQKQLNLIGRGRGKPHTP
ncbi:unnamed protein product [Ixodes hexagonus]